MGQNRWVCKMIDGQFTMIPMEESAPVVRTQILIDTINPTWHPATGEYCSSRTGMQKIAKQHDLIEVGNERLKPKERYSSAGLKEDLIKAYDQRNR